MGRRVGQAGRAGIIRIELGVYLYLIVTYNYLYIERNPPKSVLVIIISTPTLGTSGVGKKSRQARLYRIVHSMNLTDKVTVLDG